MKLHRWEDIEAEAMADPARQQRVEDEKRALIRQYNRPWWRLVRAWDRLTRRGGHSEVTDHGEGGPE